MSRNATRHMIETERMHLLPWEAADWSAFRPIVIDPEVMRFITFGHPLSDDEIRAFVARQIDGFAERGFCLWKLIRKSDSTLIGFCGIQPLVVEGVPEIEIGWRLARDSWRQGYASEAARASLRDGVARCKLNRIVAIALPENIASRRVMEKIGMEYERNIMHKDLDHVLYAIDAARAVAAQA